jgi:hypothetical protein
MHSLGTAKITSTATAVQALASRQNQIPFLAVRSLSASLTVDLHHYKHDQQPVRLHYTLQNQHKLARTGKTLLRG